MFSTIHANHIIITAIMATMMALFAFCPSTSYAQDSIAELETNKNAGGHERVHPAGRVFSEIGMGFVGMIGGAAVGVGVMAGLSSMGGLFLGMGVGELVMPP